MLSKLRRPIQQVPRQARAAVAAARGDRKDRRTFSTQGAQKSSWIAENGAKLGVGVAALAGFGYMAKAQGEQKPAESQLKPMFLAAPKARKKTSSSAGPSNMMGEHLVSPAEITEFPQFPEGTTSLLSKALTPEVWTKTHLKRDEFGFTLQEAIFSGCKMVKSGVGVYAGSQDSYYTFSPLFDAIIQMYHGHGPNDKHISSMDASKLNCPPFPADEAAMIKSTRIRVARNLAGFPLGTKVSPAQRKEIERLVVSALKGLKGDLKGKYYSLETMSDKDRKQLIADHFLFKGGDKYLQAAQLEREWPSARGIFHNNAKTFLVWVNEEDQLRIISMQQGADIGAVFTRLSKAASEIEKKAAFQHDDHLGYISTCPTNVGTGMRASVHIHLPLLGKNKELMEAIAAQYHVQVRGIHGEHSEDDSGIYDISNKRRLGRSEVELVQDMYDGVKAMIAAELKLA